MRHIPLRQPDPEWIARAEAVLEELKAASTAKERNALIDANAPLWTSLKDWLLELSHQKCWFSEAKDIFSHWDVEHFRPKKTARDADGSTHDGYWWLSFAWENLRVCGNAGNRKKGTFFPLRPGNTRAAPFGDLRYEEPQLLDPADPDDPVLISFNVEGRVTPAPHVTDAWELARVRYSIDRFNLDFPPLMDKRKVVWADCWSRLKAYERELTLYHQDPSNAVARNQLKEAARSVRALLANTQELSSVARACIVSTGNQRLLALLQST